MPVEWHAPALRRDPRCLRGGPGRPCLRFKRIHLRRSSEPLADTRRRRAPDDDRRPTVANGHVAGWVGVGGPGEGPNGKDEWIQVGFSGFAGSPNSDLYYEVTRAGSAPQYVEVAHSLPPGTSRRVAVLEVAGQPNAWRVWVDGAAVSKAIYLPQSHGAWRGIATAESWTSTGAATCNAFGYRFDDIKVAQQAGGSWQSLSNALPIRTGINKLVRVGTSAASFEAISGQLKPVPLFKPVPKPKSPRPYVAGTMKRSLAASARPVSRRPAVAPPTRARRRTTSYPWTIVIGVPSGTSRFSTSAASFDIRTQPWETACPSSCGALVPWMPTTPPPGHSVSFE